MNNPSDGHFVLQLKEIAQRFETFQHTDGDISRFFGLIETRSNLPDDSSMSVVESFLASVIFLIAQKQ